MVGGVGAASGAHRGARRRVLQRGAAAVLAVAGVACGRRNDPAGPLDFWAMGREAEVVTELLPAFHERHPAISVHVQQIPWSAAHEKLLTAYAGDSLPDLCQLGNTWIPEFSALGALEPLDARVAEARLPLDDYYAGVLDTNRMPAAVRGTDRLLGLPWYVDTRLLFYRSDLLAGAGQREPPRTWDDWRAAMGRIARRGGPGHYGALLPLNEPDPLFAFALQQGDVLDDGDTRGAFSQAPFRRALDFYAGLFHDGLAPLVGAAQIANIWDEFGPRPVRVLCHRALEHRRVPAPPAARTATRLGDRTAARSDRPGVSSAGGASLAMFRGSPRKDAAWALIAYLSETATMQRFHALTGNLPPRRSAWRSQQLSADPPSRAFAEQLERVRAAPKIPEWERIFQEMQATAERVVRGVESSDVATAQLDIRVDALLEKRRWLMARART